MMEGIVMIPDVCLGPPRSAAFLVQLRYIKHCSHYYKDSNRCQHLLHWDYKMCYYSFSKSKLKALLSSISSVIIYLFFISSSCVIFSIICKLFLVYWLSVFFLSTYIVFSICLLKGKVFVMKISRMISLQNLKY